MPRTSHSVASRRKKKRVFRHTKGNVGGRNNLWRTALETYNRSLAYAYRDRRVRKRDFRQLWITRIGIAARTCGMSYNAFINGLKKANVTLDRKMIAGLAVHDPTAFAALADIAKKHRAAS